MIRSVSLKKTLCVCYAIMCNSETEAHLAQFRIWCCTDHILSPPSSLLSPEGFLSTGRKIDRAVSNEVNEFHPFPISYQYPVQKETMKTKSSLSLLTHYVSFRKQDGGHYSEHGVHSIQLDEIAIFSQPFPSTVLQPITYLQNLSETVSKKDF